MTFIYNAKAPSQADADDKAYNEYVTKGDAFFAVGLTKQEYLDQRNRIMKDHDKHVKTTPYFYSDRIRKK